MMTKQNLPERLKLLVLLGEPDPKLPSESPRGPSGTLSTETLGLDKDAFLS